MSAETHRLTAVYKSEFPSCVFVFRNALIIRLFYLCLGSACQQESAGGRQTLRQRMFCCCVCVVVCAWIHSQQAQSVRSMGFLVVWRLQGCVWRSRSEEVCVGWHVGCWQGLCVCASLPVWPHGTYPGCARTGSGTAWRRFPLPTKPV